MTSREVEHNPMLGERLRELRQSHGMTLRELAAATGVSPALLSQLENGTSDPSLATLRKLARVFNSSVAKLFEEPEQPEVVVTHPGERMRLEAPKGLITYSRLTGGNGDLQVLEAEIEPGDASSAEPWSHASTECAVVLDGELVAEIDGENYTLSKGDAVTFNSRKPHRYLNASNARARLLIAVTPPIP